MPSAIPQSRARNGRGRRDGADRQVRSLTSFFFLFPSAVPAAALVAVVATSPLAGRAESARADADVYRAKMEQWVETRQILSEERSDWLVERESLEATRDLLRDERKALQEQIAALKQTDAGASQERDDLVAKRDAFRSSNEVLEGKVAQLEASVRKLVPQLPEPLQKRLEPILVQIPTHPETAKVGLGQRLVNVLAVVAQAEKWNGTATFVGETREVGEGQKVAVRTLYWGLAEAIYVDKQGELAGVGRPTPTGWQFTDDADLADSAKEILDIYEGIVDRIAFVPVPAEIH
ncbi:MAG: DUF3450 family protein [Myxococcota bacterium]